MDYIKRFGIAPDAKLDLDKVDASFTDKHASWFVIPANHKWFRNLAITK